MTLTEVKQARLTVYRRSTTRREIRCFQRCELWLHQQNTFYYAV